jgi:Na+/H+ antiporter NhaD/arsenite permease-like protein
MAPGPFPTALHGRSRSWFDRLVGGVAVSGSLVIAGVASAALLGEGHHAAEGGEAAAVPPLWWLGTLPFVAMLLAIAVLPLIRGAAHWWERNLHRLAVSAGLAMATLLYQLSVGGGEAVVATVRHAMLEEYLPFMVLLFSLYAITGGVAVRGEFRPSPSVNTMLLAIGAAIASLVGTTGASMLLIWPLLRANASRRHRVHTVVFFIFLVSNIGGVLLPIGDPPLFLGYLRGVPFLWTLGLWLPWLFCCGVLLLAYFAWDSILFRRESLELQAPRPALQGFRLQGGINLLWLGLAIAAVGLIKPGQALPLLGATAPAFLREGALLALVGLSLLTTPRAAREANAFNYLAIIEVACIFVGIFITMQVPLAVLAAHGASLGLATPGQFFWTTGLLSSVLDNAPTYLVFFQTAESLPQGPGSLALEGGGRIDAAILAGISLGAVFMGANTYIGNGPNFMVRSIAERAGVRMPSFFAYMLYSAAILGPLLLLVHLLFLR